MISLRPYPELPGQDLFVARICNIAGTMRKIKNCISSPFKKIHDLFSSHTKKIELLTHHFSITHPISVKTDTQTLDSKCYYILQEGKIYFKPIAAVADAPWREIPFSKKAVYINADGDNLIVVDEHKRIYYAKTYGIAFHSTDRDWTVDTFKFKWNKYWFNMDGIAAIVNFFKPAGLHAMEKAAAIAISHKGPATLYSTDCAGKRHPDPFIGVTTIYMLSPCRTRIFFADPWLHNKFHNEITGPEEGRFIMESFDASASTLFVMQRAKNGTGQEIHKMYTRFADFDSIGSNPFLPATYDRKNRTPLVRVLPAEDWLEQPAIPLEGKAHLTKQISILQTGQGQGSRELRVIGTDREGRTGYYVKKIYDPAWTFKEIGHFIPPEVFLSGTAGAGLRQGPQIAFDYKGTIQLKEGKSKAVLKKFSSVGLNERGLHTTIDLQLDSGKTVSYPLYARRGFKHLLGRSRLRPYWKLVAPDSSPLSLKTQDVKVIEKSDGIAIKGKGIRAFFAKEGAAEPLKSSPPPYVVRFFLKGLLAFLQPVKMTLKLSRRVLDRLSGNKKTLSARERFFHSLYLDDLSDTKKVLERLMAKTPSLAAKPLIDFFLQPNVFVHLKELMNGANVLIEEKEGKWQELLTGLKGIQSRRSSHAEKEKSFGIETPLFGELLLWIDSDGKLRLQFEAHSMKNTFKRFYHLIDFLKYKLHGKQQGPYGFSAYTDKNPLIIKMAEKNLIL